MPSNIPHTPLNRIAIVGGGNMGQAILAGWLKAQAGPAASFNSSSFVVVDPGEDKRAFIHDTYDVLCIDRVEDLPECEMVVLAVKPQVVPVVLESMNGLSWLQDALCISIAAGLSTERLEAMLPKQTSLVRAMPNMPLLVGQGATALCAGRCATEEHLIFARDLFASIGNAYMVAEENIDATTAISGSGPAYVAAFVEALAEAGQGVGLDKDVSMKLAQDTLVGTAALLQDGMSAEEIRRAVSSPNGTTVAGLAAMEAQGFAPSIEAGVRAAYKRSKELGA